jgi:hypothetical protein
MFVLPPAGAPATRFAFACVQDVCTANTDGTGRRQLTHGRQLSDMRFGVLAAAGGVIAYANGFDVVLMRMSGARIGRIRSRHMTEVGDLGIRGGRVLWTQIAPAGNAGRWCTRAIAGGRIRCGRWDARWVWYSWGPGGKVVAVEQASSTPGPRFRHRICVLGRRNRCARVIARTGNEDTTTFWGPPAVSPDGRLLAITEDIELSTPEGFGDSRSALSLFSTRTGRRVRRLSYSGEHEDDNPSWSPDGRWVWFDHDSIWPGTPDQRAAWTIWRVRAAGGKPRRVLKGGRMPAWAD